MNWIVLILSGVGESAWATALGYIDGIHKPIPIIVFVAGMLLSMLGLSYAMKTIPTGTAYAVWTGIGAALTVVIGMFLKTEPISVARILLLIGLVGCVIGLKVVS